MKQQYVRHMNTVIKMSLMILFMLIMGGTVPLFADDHEDKRNWELLIGGGGSISPKYSGSDEVSIILIPLIVAHYENHYLDFFVEGEEVGVSLKFGNTIPVSLSTGIGLGEDRENDDGDVLKGTPNLENSYRLFGGLQVSLPFIDISSTVNYFPITANYDETDRLDKDYNGILVDGEVGKEWFRIPFIVNISTGVSWMNSAYAEANYSVNYETDRFNLFKAKSGMHDVHVATRVTMMFSERMGMMFMGKGTYLLGDAADSPLTQNTFQPSGKVFLFYRF